ncbi:uncharacterized protein Z518_04239 [Rhinocladiella mackenziei CBS 650.93]|uniref:amidase n=1 Tax=Rhinocladiella mackenziei CBS 650.93 TaxID=1442369 RepID=A0A0D2IKM1_9EURO|nr:uncharacterized protein Z518_04239 [Rhinocladiella mackenziei CBS 650.93]KIX06264.1 hypothetical protein Z518_04239 [Rhinocladiella mackenziei CBS 650.93]
MAKRSWEEIVREKCETRQRLVEPYLDKTNGERETAVAVLNIDNVECLTSLLASGKVKAHDITLSYIRRYPNEWNYPAHLSLTNWDRSRAAEAHQMTNCLTEVFFDDAIKEADRLDDYYHRHGKLIGPLHGIPVTLKDQFDVAGADSTMGYVSRAFSPADKDAVLVHILRDLGAWCETENPLWGLTTNPRNPDFTPGGSSGGEGVLLALQASMIGWGTDIGGSIRIPSHMNGLWGLKPTSSRLPYQGVPVSTEGQEHVPSSVGPLTRSLSSLTTVMQQVIEMKAWIFDPKVVPIPWRQDVYEEVHQRPLTIGVLFDDGVVKVHPPIERVLRELESKLKAAGHEIVPWDASGHRECIEIMDLFYTADGGEDIRREVQAGGEPFIPHVEALINRGSPISVYEYWQLNKRKLAAQKAYNEKWNTIKSPMTGRSVDVVLMPTMPHTAVPHRTCRWVGYTKVWNFLDYTALSFPAGQVIASKDIAPPEYQPRNDYDAWNWKLYDPVTMDDHPVGLQIVGRRFEEEKVLGVASVINQIMRA